jgi:glycosyltransferase involved in cell wall biosynthesis
MRILILTQYFYPETGAPQSRLYSLAHHLSVRGAKVSILTAMPNYPKMEVFAEYKYRFYLKENDGPLTIFRSFIYVKKNLGSTGRLLIYFSFVISSMIVGWIKTGKQDIIICESPPLFLGLTALFLRWSKKSKLIFNVSDLWPESVEKLKIIKSKVLLKMAYGLEKRIYSKSILVSGQTKGIMQNIKTRFPEVRTLLFRNGIDYKQFDVCADGSEFRTRMDLTENSFVLIYAGVIGHAQGLETILQAAEKVKEQIEIRFFMVGDGPEKESLVHLANERKISNVVFISNKPQNEIPGIIAACDAYIVPLKKLDLFLGAIPSKIFEPLAMGKPIILGVDGEAKELFIDQGKCGLYYEPEDSTGLAQCISELYYNKYLARKLGENGRNYIRENFDRAKIADAFYNELLKLV